MQKLFAILITLAMVFGLTACSSAMDREESGAAVIINPAADSRESQLTILISDINYNNLPKFIFDSLKNFREKYGIRISFDVVEIHNPITITSDSSIYNFLDSEARNEYNDKLIDKMHSKDGPELIFYSGDYFDFLINQEAIMDVKGKIPNLKNIYTCLLDSKIDYIPIGIKYNSKVLNRNLLDELGIEAPSLNWSKSDYEAIMNTWTQKIKLPFTKHIYYDLVNDKLDFICIEAVKSKAISLNNDDMKEFISSTRNKLLFGSYNINSKYKYRNLYNMVFESKSFEFLNNVKTENSYLYRTKLIKSEGIYCNLLRVDSVAEAIEKQTAVILPGFSDQTEYLGSVGFMVNKNGRNTDLALELLDVLLSDEMQLKLYNGKYLWYPVNKNLESEISEIDNELSLNYNALQLKKHVLSDLKSGRCKLAVNLRNRAYEMQYFLSRDLAKFILEPSPLYNSELSTELQKLEDKYITWLNQ